MTCAPGVRACAPRGAESWLHGAGRGCQMGLGKVLMVEKMRFEDLDELVVGYLDPVVANENK